MSTFIWTDRAKDQLRAIDREQVRVRLEMAEEDTYRILRVAHRKQAYRS